MIPLRDTTRSKSFPIINISIIGINVLVFLYQMTLSPEYLGRFIYTYGVIPAQLTSVSLLNLLINPLTLFPLVSATFLHGNLLHILGNMLFLWVFGDNIEDRFGHFKYIVFYFLAAFIAHFAHIYADPTSQVPTIGASGAVAGVLGAYFLAFPRAKVLALIPIFVFFTLLEVPAVIFLFLWFVLQLINGLSIFTGSTGAQTVAWWAHIGGFVGGAILYYIYKTRFEISKIRV